MEDESIKLFFSYSHKDEALRNELVNHLHILTRQGMISSWHDRKILPGDEWNHHIHAHLETADIILLLISADFIASDYCLDTEVATALRRHASGETCVIPILLRPVDWTGALFAQLQALPTHGKPVTMWVDRDEAFLDVAQGIRKIAELLRARRTQKFAEKQHVNDQYKQKVEEILSSSSGYISVIPRDTLNELREKLRLTTEEAQVIEARAFEPYKIYEANLEKYKHTLLKVLEQYPFSEEIKKELEYRQRDLGIKAEDVERIEQPLLAPVKAAYDNKLHRYQQEFSTLVHTRYPLEQDVRPGLQSLQWSLGLSDDDIVHIEENVVHQYEANLEKYKHTLLKVLEQYPFSEEIKKELEYRQRDLGIKAEDVERIEQPLLAPVKAAYDNKLHRYQQEFSTLVHTRYPLEQDVRPGLQSLQRSLGLSDDDIVHIEENVVHQYEANLEKYKHTLLKVLEQYPFSEEIKKELEYRQRDLGIKAEDVERIEQPLLAPVKAAYDNKLHRYQQEFSTLVHTRYPLEQDVRPGLQSLQRSLGLSDDDIVHIEENVVHQYEANLEKYKHTLLKVLEQYPFSEEIKKELEYRQRDLGIKAEDVERIEQPLLAPVKAAYDNKLHRYQQEFSTLVHTRYPLEQDVRPGLQSLQRSLGLSDDDVAHIEENVVHQREAKQLSTPLVSPLDAKADQQPFVPASTDSQPNRSPCLSLLQKPFLLAGGSIAVVFAVVLTFFPLARTPQHPQSKFDKQYSQEAPADSPQSSVAPDSTELPRMVPASEVSPPRAEALAVPVVPAQARAPEAIHGECVPALQARGFWCRRSSQSPCLRSIDVSATGEVRPTGVLCDSQDAEQVRTLLEQIPGVRKVVMEGVNFLQTWNKNYVPPGCVVRPWNTNLGRTP